MAKTAGFVTSAKPIISDVSSLAHESKTLETEVTELENMESQATAARSAGVKAAKETAMALEAAMEDVRKTLRMYERLGLSFTPGEGGTLQVSFTQIDAADPAKPFTFVLLVGEGEVYNGTFLVSTRVVSHTHTHTLHCVGWFLCLLTPLFSFVFPLSCVLIQ